jgi:hypothetical protein
MDQTDFEIGPQAIDAYSRLSYSMWHALGEFIDNSTQSRLNYDGIVSDLLQQEGTPLVVKINYDRPNRVITIEDNSIGMTRDKLIEALKVGIPTSDSKGRSRFGMGMKTAACWIGKKWQVVTCEWSKGEEWTADIDVKAIAYNGHCVPLSMRKVDSNAHYTKIIISDLNRNIQLRTEETIKGFLGSMYRYDIKNGTLKLLYNDEEIPAPDEYDFDTDPDGKLMRMDLPAKTIGGKVVSGWIGVLKKGGRKFGGFSLFQHERQIQGFPNAWKPKTIFGGVDDEGANNLVSQRLIGVINLDGFQVSHTKDAVLFEGDEEDELETFLRETSSDYRNFAQKRRGAREQPWNREKIRELVTSMRQEFSSPEMKDVLATVILPPIEAIQQNNQKQMESVTEDEKLATFQVTDDLRVTISLKEMSEFEPHLTVTAGANAGQVHVIVNGLHPYYTNLESPDAIDECLRQYIYDAIAEYRVTKLLGRVNADSVRRLKDSLLRAQDLRLENAAAAIRDGDTMVSLRSATNK